MAKKIFTAEALNYVVGECLLCLWGAQVAEGPYFSLCASMLPVVFRTIPENEKSLTIQSFGSGIGKCKIRRSGVIT